ncbi:MAG TPA: hypothetical protein DEH11_08850, partial [Actinobacteria bacterium]|nr:hypothetical protein [Actinomycetota bacterium]
MPRTSRTIKAVALGVSGLVAGGVLYSALAPGSSAKISLSSDSMMHHGSGWRSARHWSFSTLDNQNDPTFNQLLGINNRGEIAGYLGSGAKGHPNKGYLLVLSGRGSAYVNENVPGARQTQVTGLNDLGVTVGFFSTQNKASMMNNNFGFYAVHGRFHRVDFPTNVPAKPPVDQLLGINDRDIAVGFYTNDQGNNRGYLYDIRTGQFSRVLVPGMPAGLKGPSLTAAAINNSDDVAGFYAAAGGTTDGFLMAGRHFYTLAYPGAAMTQAFGVNDEREVVGTYATGSGSSAKTYGFTWTRRTGFRTVSDPAGLGATTINGVNDAGDLVGFYTDAAGNTDGLLWAAGRHTAPMAPMMPTQSAMPGMMPSSTPSMMPSSMPSAMPSSMPSS